MNYTENYNLPQWEETDRIDRAAINAAMSTIDAVLAANASPFVKIAETVLAEDAQQIALHVGDINFFDYWQIFLYYSTPSSTARCCVRLNDVNYSYSRDLHGVESSYPPGYEELCTMYPGTWLMFYPPTEYFVCSTAQMIYPERKFFDTQSSVYWRDLAKISVQPYDAGKIIPAGSYITLFGLRR